MSDDTIRLRYDLDPGLMVRVMMVAGQRVQSKAPVRERVWAFGAVALMFSGALVLLPVIERLFGVTVSGVGFLVGIAFAIVAITGMQRSAIRMLAKAATDSAMRRGPVVLTISEGGIAEQSGIGRIDVVWDAVDEITTVRGGSVVRFGAMCFVVPDEALPAELPPAEFRAQLTAWQSASETFG